MSNAHTDASAKFWSADRDHSMEVGPGYAEDVSNDVAAAIKEASERSELDDEVEQSRDNLETLRRVHGSVKDGIEWNTKLREYYYADPEAAREFHKRTYYGRMPDVGPAPEVKAEPPADLTEQGREEWERDQAARNAYRTASADAAYRQEIADAAPLLKKVRETYGPLTGALQQAAAIHEAMTVNPETAHRLSFVAGAPATQGHAQEIAQNNERVRATNQWFEQVVASGTMPGLERADIQHAITRGLEGMYARGQGSGDATQDLRKAYDAAMTVANQIEAEKNARDLIAKIDAKIDGKKARKSASADEDEKDDIRETVRAARRAHMGAAA